MFDELSELEVRKEMKRYSQELREQEPRMDTLREEVQERAERNKRKADKKVREIEITPSKDLREVEEKCV